VFSGSLRIVMLAMQSMISLIALIASQNTKRLKAIQGADALATPERRALIRIFR
jgi:hypothetical protein